MSTDPDELANLAKDSAHLETLNQLTGQMKAYQLKTKDPWQIMWDNESQVQGTGVGLSLTGNCVAGVVRLQAWERKKNNVGFLLPNSSSVWLSPLK